MRSQKNALGRAAAPLPTGFSSSHSLRLLFLLSTTQAVFLTHDRKPSFFSCFTRVAVVPWNGFPYCYALKTLNYIPDSTPQDSALQIIPKSLSQIISLSNYGNSLGG